MPEFDPSISVTTTAGDTPTDAPGCGVGGKRTGKTFGNRGRVRRFGRPSRQPRRHPDGCLAGAAPEAARVSAADGVDVVVEGRAVRVTDGPTLERVADEYRSKYGWDAEPREGEFRGEGAPTAGPPPLHLYELVPETAFGFGTDESLNAMRWTFDRQ